MSVVQTRALDTFIRETGSAVAVQLEACTRCGLCAEACHFYVSTHKPEYTPIWKVELVRRAYEQRFTPIGRLKVALDHQLDEGSPLGVDDDTLDDRLEWVEDDWDVEFPLDQQGAEALLVFSSIEIMKFPDNLAAISKILNAGASTGR